jgi:uncharacterized protein YecE (DUF72 family)
MKLWLGTSGYSYKEWKGIFYPEDLPAAKMLSFYASHFDAVEINNSFYRMPTAETFEKWGSQVPSEFRFAIKAPQRITHQKRLSETGEEVQRLVAFSDVLGQRRGPILFQLPPFFKKNIDLLRQFLGALPRGPEVAFEFRHASWFDDETFATLADHDVAICAAESDDSVAPPQISTAGWGYLRLRRTDYDAESLRRWVERISGEDWSHAYLFFKHEDEALGPRFAREFQKLRG